jgi:fibronectin-binding autotransporter adhesin
MNKYTHRVALGLIVLILTSAPMASYGQNVYWDANGTTLGAGTTPNGTWGVDDFWNTFTNGGAGTFSATTTATSTNFFSAGTDAINPYTVTVNGTQSSGGINFEDGTPTLTGGTILMSTNKTVRAFSSLKGTATIESAVSVNTDAGGTITFTLTADDGAGVTDLLIKGPISATTTANKYQLRFGGAGNGRIEGAIIDHGPTISQTAAGWTGTWTIAGNQTLGSTAISLTANDNKLVMGDGSSDVQSWGGTTTLGATNTVLTVRSTATAAGVTLREGGNNVLQVPGNLSGTTLQFGTNASATSGATLRLSDGATAGSASFTLLTINGSGHKVVGGAAEAGTMNFNLSSARTIDAGLVLGGAGANENNFNVVKTGAGVLTLSGANTFNGFTRLDSGGGIVLANANALQNSTLTPNGGGSVVFSNGAAFTVGGLAASSSGSGFNLALTNTAGSAVALSVGGNNASTTYAGVMSGGGSLVKAGSGTLTLTGANTYSGGTTVNGGALAGTTAGIRGDIANNAAVIFDQATAGTYGNVMSGNGTLVKRGAGTLTITNANSYSGVTSIEEGSLTLNTTGSLAVESAVVMAAGAGLVINRTAASVLSNTLSGAGSLTRASTGDLTLAASNSHTGGTFMGANNLVMGANGALGYGVLSLDSSANSSRLLLNGTTNTITGLTLTGASAQVIQNDGTGGSAGRLIFDVGAGQTVASASTLLIRDRSTNNADLGTLSLVKTGAGTLDLSQIAANSAYSGGLTISAGTVSYTSLAALGSIGSTVTLGGGKLNYTGSTDITNSRAVTLVSATTSTMENAAGTVRYTGAISGDGNFTKTGAGILNLDANNSYTGTTTVSEGTLLVNSTNSGSGALIVNSGATLGGSGTIGGNTLISSGATLSPGNSPGVLNILGDLTLEGTVVMELNGLARGSQYDGINVGGTLYYGGALTLNFGNTFNAGDSFNLFDFTDSNGFFDSITLEGSYSGSLTRNASNSTWTGSIGGQDFAFYDVSGTLEVVPEPSTYALLILAGAGLAGHVWRRRARR